MNKWALLTCVWLFSLIPATALAQSLKTAHWGVTFSVTPGWRMADFVTKAIAEDASEINFRGNEFTVGIGRGSRRGGDWGFSYVRKRVKDGVVFVEDTTDCFEPGPGNPIICPRSHEVQIFDRVIMNGLEVHWFIPFVRIKDRVQIGVNLGGGVAKLSGNITTVKDFEDSQCIPRPVGFGCDNVLIPVHEEETNPAADELLKLFPLIKLEVQGAVIVSPAVKIKIAGGLNFPSTSFRVLAVYLFGAK